MNAQEIVAFAEASLAEVLAQQKKLKEKEAFWQRIINKGGEELTVQEEEPVTLERGRLELEAAEMRAYETRVHAELQDFEPHFRRNMRALRLACAEEEFAGHLQDLGLTREQWNDLESGDVTRVPGAAIQNFFWVLGARKGDWTERALPQKQRVTRSRSRA